MLICIYIILFITIPFKKKANKARVQLKVIQDWKERNGREWIVAFVALPDIITYLRYFIEYHFCFTILRLMAVGSKKFSILGIGKCVVLLWKLLSFKKTKHFLILLAIPLKFSLFVPYFSVMLKLLNTAISSYCWEFISGIKESAERSKL